MAAPSCPRNEQKFPIPPFFLWVGSDLHTQQLWVAEPDPWVSSGCLCREMGARFRTWNAGMLLSPASTWILSLSQAPFQLELLHHPLVVHPMQISRALLVLVGFLLQLSGVFRTLRPKKSPRGSFLWASSPLGLSPIPFGWRCLEQKGVKGPVATTEQQLPTTSGK